MKDSKPYAPGLFFFWNLLEDYLFKRSQRNSVMHRAPLSTVTDRKYMYTDILEVWGQGKGRGMGGQQNPLTLRIKIKWL